MFKACGRCGKVHISAYKCPEIRIYSGGDERKLRSSYSWTKKAEQIKQEANYLCEVCREEGRYTYDGLEVHHIIRVREDPSLLLDNDNLVCLCTAHHKQADAGQINAEYLRKLAHDRGRG